MGALLLPCGCAAVTLGAAQGRYNRRMPDRPRATALLGGLAPSRFLARYWQRRPLLIRGAIQGFEGLLTPQDLMHLACRDDTQARVVVRHARKWEVHHGPFKPRFFHDLGPRGWTLLVQDVNHLLPEGRALLERFSFVPYARLDDLMVSYAPPGGGVGPHCDSYDVFLLQGRGHRRWRISAQRDLSLVAGAPLKLLARFHAQHEWQLGPGDMLYLPPGYAHDGMAMDECMTYSIGFRAPSWQELGEQFLTHLQDEIQLPGLYRDPGLRPTAQPARIGRDMLSQAQLHLGRIRWSPTDVLQFLGRYLTEPKPQVFFIRPQPAFAPAAFARQAERNGVVLDLKTQMLYAATSVFINGEQVSAQGLLLRRLQRLADQRALFLTSDEPHGLAQLLHGWYLAGYVAPGSGDTS